MRRLRYPAGLILAASSGPAFASDPTAFLGWLVLVGLVLPWLVVHFIVILVLASKGLYRNRKLTVWHSVGLAAVPLLALLLQLAFVQAPSGAGAVMYGALFVLALLPLLFHFVLLSD